MKTEEFADQIIDMYVNQKLNTVEIGKILGFDDSSIGRLLKRHGIKCIYTPNMLHATEVDMDNMCLMYELGFTTKIIGELFNMCDASVAKLLRSRGVEIKRAVRYSPVRNHDYFRNIDSIGKAYFLGWMISDGAIIESKNRPDRALIISLEIHNDDRKILELFARELGADVSLVKTNTKRKHAYIRFASDEMANDLSKYGVVPRKSNITYLPKISDDLMPHLVRGIFDGDGTVTIDKHNCIHFAFYGSKRICEEIRGCLHEKLGLNLTKVSKSTCYHVWWGGRKPPKLFSDYIYHNCGDYVLERKKNRFQKD